MYQLANQNFENEVSFLCWREVSLKSKVAKANGDIYIIIIHHRTKWHLDPSCRLTTTDGPKIGESCAFFGGGGRSRVPI